MNNWQKLSITACLLLCVSCTKEQTSTSEYDSRPERGPDKTSFSPNNSSPAAANFVNISKAKQTEQSNETPDESMMKMMGEPIAFANDVIFKVHPIHIESWKPGMPLDMVLELSEKFPEPSPVPQLLVRHEKLAHLFLISKDMAVFQHLHPDLERPGLMRQMTESIPKGGEYLLFLQFTTAQRGERTVVQKLYLPGATTQAKLSVNWNKPVFIDGYKFELKDCPLIANRMYMPEVEITRQGKALDYVQPFLGAGAHGLILNDKMTQFIHVHPVSEPQNGLYSSPIVFHTRLFQKGTYRFWAQFMIEGRFYVVPFTFNVSE